MSTATPAPGARLWSAVVRGLEWFTITLFAVLVIDVLWGVFSRYVLGHQSQWTEEVAIYLLVWVSLLGAALTFREHGHLGIDYVVTKFDPVAQRLAAIIGELCVLLFSLLALVYGGWTLVQSNLDRGQLTPALQWKVGYLYSAVPLCGIFMCAFVVEHLLAKPASTAPVAKGDV